MEPVFNQEQIVINHANRTVITTSNLQNNSKQTTTTKQPVITWNDESEYPMLDELSRIAKVRKILFFFCCRYFICDLFSLLAKARSCLDKERSNSKSMLLLIEFARTMIEDNECVVLYFEPVRMNLFCEICFSEILRNFLTMSRIRLIGQISREIYTNKLKIQ